MSRGMILLVLPLAWGMAVAPSGATTWHIYPDGSGDWPTIQVALDSGLAGDTVLLACGVFHEHDIRLRTGIVLRSETGDPGCVTIDGDNLGQVLIAENLGPGTVVEGLTITGGFAPDVEYPHNKGAGMLVFHCSPLIQRCVFTGNHAVSGGGGIFLAQSSSQVVDCAFLGNWTDFDGGGLYGYGTGTVTRSLFAGNQAYLGGGAHLLSSECGLHFNQCTFSGNSASEGGGGVFSGDQAAPTFDGCTLFGNSAVNRGGAVYCLNYGEAHLLNCTLSDNRCESGAGGVDCWAYGKAELENTILAFSTQGPAVFCNVGGRATLTCSDVYGNAGGDWTGYIASQAGLNGNFSADPRFCDRPGGDYTLASDSPCLDAPGCGLVGAFGEGCGGPTATEETTWGGVKRIFR